MLRVGLGLQFGFVAYRRTRSVRFRIRVRVRVRVSITGSITVRITSFCHQLVTMEFEPGAGRAERQVVEHRARW